MLLDDPIPPGDQQQSGSDPRVQSPAPPLPLSQPPSSLPNAPPGPASVSHLSPLSRSAALPILCSADSWFDTSAVQQPRGDVSPMLPALITRSTAGFCQQADHSPAAFAGHSPDSARSASMACHFFSRQAVGAHGQPEGHQLQGHYQEPYQEQCQQYLWQQGQGQYPEGPYQEPFQAQPSQEQLWGQSMTHQAHQLNALWGGSCSLEEPQDIRGKAPMAAATEVAACFSNPLDPWLSNASSASHASFQHAASGGLTPQTQPQMYGQRFDQVLDTAPSAVLLPSVDRVVPSTTGCGHKRKAHKNQVHQDDLADLDDAAVAEILADPFSAASASGACWTDTAANSSGAACAYGQHLQLGGMAYTAQQCLPAAAAAAIETKQPEKKQKTGHSSSSSRAVYRAAVPLAAHGRIWGPTAAGPSLQASRGYSSMALPPNPPQAASPASPSQRTHVHAARFSQTPLQGTGAMVQPNQVMQPTPMVHPQASGGPAAQASPQPQSPSGPLGHPPTPARTRGCQNRPQAQSKTQRRPKDQARPKAEPRSNQPDSQPMPQAQPRLQPRPKVAVPPSNSAANRRGAPAATQRGAPTATRRTAQAAAHTAAPAALPAAPPSAAPAAPPAAAPAAAPAQGSGYQVGQLVWARCGKCPWWPATVSFTSSGYQTPLLDTHACIQYNNRKCD